MPAQETKRQIGSLVLICVGNTNKKYNATLTASKSAKSAAFTFDNGIAMSNAGLLLGGKPPLPLNNLVGLNLNQPFVLEITRSGVAGELKQLFDVVLNLNYEATF